MADADDDATSFTVYLMLLRLSSFSSSLVFDAFNFGKISSGDVGVGINRENSDVDDDDDDDGYLLLLLLL